ncbi:DUF6907 domain-containing protein [Nocardia sp. NPDC051052]|uniref:DUF6907 domain-containing protein n=1 Tax=Nocardia sp. NPDC051052 TaxID=3364322 RepID=UPI0037979A00
MTDIASLRNCPSWCVDHHDPDEPDAGHMHFAAEATMHVARHANPRRVGLGRTDSTTAGQPPHTTIVVDLGDGGHEMTVEEATELAGLIAVQVTRATGD